MFPFELSNGTVAAYIALVTLGSMSATNDTLFVESSCGAVYSRITR